MKRVDIRFNTNFPESSNFEWRVLINGEEKLANKVYMETPTITSKSDLPGVGVKYHISTVANNVHFEDCSDGIVAYIS